MNESSKAIVLRCTDFQESSKIVTVYSELHGRMALIAKGAKKLKSKFAGFLETGSILDIQYSFKAGREVQLLTDTSHRYKTFRIREDFGKLALMMSTLEFVNQLSHEGDTNKEMYPFLETFLIWLAEVEEECVTLFPYVQCRLAEIMGIQLQLDESNSEPQDWFINVESGSVSPVNEFGLSLRLTTTQLNYLSLALQRKGRQLVDFPMTKLDHQNLIRHLDVYFRHHIYGLRDRNSDYIFAQLNPF